MQSHLGEAPKAELDQGLDRNYVHNLQEVPVINYTQLKAELIQLKEELLTANLPNESQVVVNADKAIDHLLQRAEIERQLAITLSKICGTLIVDIEKAIQNDLQAARNLREEALALQGRSSDVRNKVVSLVDTKKGAP
jgi:hypothetical protein